jgi:hypothetical protein
MVQTEFEFTLPCGFVDEWGNLHRHGVMRRATALDEVEPLADPRVRANEAYLSILLLSRVVVSLGTLGSLAPAAVGELYAPDFTYLQDLYTRINGVAEQRIETECPGCGTHFALDLAAADA